MISMAVGDVYLCQFFVRYGCFDPRYEASGLGCGDGCIDEDSGGRRVDEGASNGRPLPAYCAIGLLPGNRRGYVDINFEGRHLENTPGCKNVKIIESKDSFNFWIFGVLILRTCNLQ